MNTHYEETQKAMDRMKIWTVNAYDDYEHRVYAYTSLNKAIKKAYEIATECIRIYDEVNGKGSFFEQCGNDNLFKYNLKTCKELVKQSMIERYHYQFYFSDSPYGNVDLIYSIQIQGHDGKE
jgi:hypothetical protein